MNLSPAAWARILPFLLFLGLFFPFSPSLTFRYTVLDRCRASSLMSSMSMSLLSGYGLACSLSSATTSLSFSSMFPGSTTLRRSWVVIPVRPKLIRARQLHLGHGPVN